MQPEFPRPLGRVLVTGGCGFIGSALVHRLLANAATSDRSVLNYDALTYAGLPESVEDLATDPRHAFVQGDVADAGALTNAIQQLRPDTLFHLAAESHVDRSIAAPQTFVRTNVQGTAAVLATWRDYVGSLPSEAAANALMVHVSTDEVYGPVAAPHASLEGDPYAPSSPYSATKAAADHLVRAYRTTYGTPVVIAHSTNNYGPRQCPEKLIPLVIERGLAEQPLPLYGDGQQVRDWLHVDDHCDALVAIAERGATGESYHIGASERRTNAEVVGLLCDLIDEATPTADGRPRRELIVRVEDRPGHDRRYALNADKLRGSLGWRPRVAFEEGLASTVAWRLENDAWVAAALDRLANCR
ncbi:MAG: dTDP-glucose 4,6-dehydratase [Planctomycetota bacterium]